MVRVLILFDFSTFKFAEGFFLGGVGQDTVYIISCANTGKERVFCCSCTEVSISVTQILLADGIVQHRLASLIILFSLYISY